MLGLSVFVLVWLRLLVARMAGSDPLTEPDLPKWQKLSAEFMHFALYFLMIGMPLGGWLLLGAAGKPIPFFGLELPALVGESKSLATLIKEIHEVGGTVGYLLIGFHAAAALLHHYVLRDNTLRRIVPNQN